MSARIFTPVTTVPSASLTVVPWSVRNGPPAGICLIAQNPAADARDFYSPRIGLVLSASDNAEQYVMPSFVGKPAQESADILQQAGFKLGNSSESRKRPLASTSGSVALTGIVVKQYPAAGQKIAGGSTIYFEIMK